MDLKPFTLYNKLCMDTLNNQLSSRPPLVYAERRDGEVDLKPFTLYNKLCMDTLNNQLSSRPPLVYAERRDGTSNIAGYYNDGLTNLYEN